MKRTSLLAAFALLSLVAVAPPSHAQGAPTKAAEAARQQKLKAQQAAALQAAAAARANATATPVATINRPIPTAAVLATAPPTGTAAPAASASAKPTGSAVPAGSAVPVALATHTETAAIALDLDALKKTRPDRRHAEFLDLQARWGNLLADPRAAAELKQHSSRIAYLQRVRALGSKANDTAFVKSVDALITKEESRDADAMNALRSGALPVAAPAAAAPAAAAPTPASGASK